MAQLPGSPVIDRGDSSAITTDQRGRARPTDLPNYENAIDGDGADLGAFEVGGRFASSSALQRTTLKGVKPPSFPILVII